MSGDRFQNIFIAILLGLVITCSQILFMCLLSGSNNPVEAYLKLCQWDSGWYTHILENGYRSTIPPVAQNGDLSNVAFFPGYPLIARAFKKVFGLTTPLALLVGAQLACWGFWTYLFVFFQRWQISTRLAIGGAVAILVHPAAFFLVAGYSESLFLMALLGFLYWSSLDSRPTSPRAARLSSNYTGLSSGFLAVIHGFVMSATRVVGLPLALYPVFNFLILSFGKRSREINLFPQKVSNSELTQRAKWKFFMRKSYKYLLISGLASLGCLLFFAFCYFKFGYWDIYMQTQAIGWRIKPNYLAIFNWEIYRYFIDAQDLSTFISRLSLPVTMVFFLGSFLAEWRVAQLFKETNWQQRAGFYLCGWLMFYISACGLASVGMKSMIRYTFCVHVMLVMALVHLLSRLQFKAVSKDWFVFILLMLATDSFLIHIRLAYMFTHGEWVA